MKLVLTYRDWVDTVLKVEGVQYFTPKVGIRMIGGYKEEGELFLLFEVVNEKKFLLYVMNERISYKIVER